MYNKALLLIKHRQISIYKKSQNIKSPYFINNHQHSPFIINANQQLKTSSDS